MGTSVEVPTPALLALGHDGSNHALCQGPNWAKILVARATERELVGEMHSLPTIHSSVNFHRFHILPDPSEENKHLKAE